jgi:hypothetical protein
MLTRVAEDAQRALLAVEQPEGLLDDEQVTAAYELLGELIGLDFDVGQDGVPQLHRGTRSGRVISVIDPEMQHVRKNSQSWVRWVQAVRRGPQRPGAVDHGGARRAGR